MYKLLIVDDEEIVRLGLKKFVAWEELGYEVVGDVESAKEALKIIDMEDVDVVLTDIKMPEMDGLELIERAKQSNVSIKTVILSGYEEFESAKKALRLGAFDFLTKPVNFDELRKIFMDLREILNKEHADRIKKEQYLILEKERLLNNLSKGLYTNGIDNKKFNDVGIRVDGVNFRSIRIYITKSSYINRNLTSTKEIVSSNIYNSLLPYGKCYIYNNDLCEVAVLFISDLSIDELIGEFDDLQENLENQFNIHTHIGVGERYCGSENISVSYSEAGKALEYRIIKMRSSVLVYSQLCSFFKCQTFINEEVRTNILSYLTQADEQTLLEYLELLLSEIIKCNNISILYDSCIEIFYIITKHMASIDENIFSEDKQYLNVRELLEKDTFEDIKNSICSYVKKAITTSKTVKENSKGHIIESAKKYINEHFAEEVSLNKLSEILYIHPIYLSKLFKGKTSENFIDYLTRVRVEKSKELLGDISLKVYEISEMIGYDSPKYFSKVFKDITGITPKEYRDNIVV